MIKLFKLIFPLSLVLLIASCSKDDDTAARSGLEGTWTATAMPVNLTNSAGGTTAVSTITGNTFDYDLSFEESTFSTEGNYSATSVVVVDGYSTITDIDYTDVMSAGSYSIDGNIITIEGDGFFNFEAPGTIDPTGGAGMTGTQNATFEINGDVLTMSQNETLTTTFNGITTTAIIVGSYTFERK